MDGDDLVVVRERRARRREEKGKEVPMQQGGFGSGLRTAWERWAVKCPKGSFPSPTGHLTLQLDGVLHSQTTVNTTSTREELGKISATEARAENSPSE